MTVADAAGYGRSDADLGMLTGVRSGKRSFYPEYVRSAERLELAVRALDRISRALVRTAESPRGLVEAVLSAAAEHLQADWLLVAIADGVLRAVRPRFLFLTGSGLVDDRRALPPEALAHLQTLQSRPWEAENPGAGTVVRVAMTLDGEPVGGIAGLPGRDVVVAETDLAILRVLANQAAVALHNAFLVHAATQLRGRTEELSEAAERRERDLAERDAELAETQQRLLQATQRQVLDDERHRIARELHDSVAQDVLSAGMKVELCRADLAAAQDEAGPVLEQLTEAKELTRSAVERLRASIYALHNSAEEPPGSLPALLQHLCNVHQPSDLKVRLRVAGTPAPLPVEVEGSVLRIAGEALFNSTTHSTATEATISLRYQPDRVVMTVSDDGDGDPAVLRKMLRVTSAVDLAGAHRGLANMRSRVRELSGEMSIRRSRAGGIMLRFEFPVPWVVRERAE